VVEGKCCIIVAGFKNKMKKKIKSVRHKEQSEKKKMEALVRLTF